jgi:hypothetical protein
VSLYAADGSINVTVVDGTSYTGIYAPDGSLNVIKSTGSFWVGSHHPCGAQYVTTTVGGFVPYYAPDGSIYVTNLGMPSTNQGQPVTVVSGTLFGPPPTGFYYPFLFF